MQRHPYEWPISAENHWPDDGRQLTPEVSLGIRRCMALGADPLNDKEVHIWRGKHGVNFQLAYTRMAPPSAVLPSQSKSRQRVSQAAGNVGHLANRRHPSDQ